jgi:exosortase A
MTAAATLRFWQPLLPALVLAAAVLAALFGAEIGAATHVWNSSTAYGHCWLVLPIVGWLVYERRFEAQATPGSPALWPAVLALPLVALWIGADLLGLMEGRQIALIGFVELALLAALGARLYWVLSAAFLYLIFLVPFGAFLTTSLQDFTAAFVAHGLDLFGVPNRVTAFQIEIPEGNFYVAEACAGLRFLIASIAFGALYAVTMFQSPWRRLAFIAVSCVVPVIANGFRGLGIVLLGHVLGSAEAAATDHVLYGWIFFSLVIVGLALAGMPFRQDPPVLRPAPAMLAPGTGWWRAALAVLPVLGVAALGPAVSMALDARAVAPGDARQIFSAPAGCAMIGVAPQGAVLIQTFQCGDAVVTARTELLPTRANPAWVMRAGADWVGAMVPGHDVDNRLLAVGGVAPATWHLTMDTESPRAAASVVYVDGRPVLGGLRDRLHLARDLLAGATGAAGAPVSLAVAAELADGDGAAVLRHFLEGQGDLRARVVAASRR